MLRQSASARPLRSPRALAIILTGSECDFSTIRLRACLELRVMRFLNCFCLAFCCTLTTFSHSQGGIKIVSDWSTDWDVGSSITYVKLSTRAWQTLYGENPETLVWMYQQSRIGTPGKPLLSKQGERMLEYAIYFTLIMKLHGGIMSIREQGRLSCKA